MAEPAWSVIEVPPRVTLRRDALRMRMISAAAALAVLAGFGHPAGAAAAHSVSLPGGLNYRDLKTGTGPAAKAGEKVVVAYTGWLDQNGKKGKMFDSSSEHGGTFTFTLGAHQVIPGWDEGVAGMKKGGERKLVIPPKLAYGSTGAGGAIPPNATLIFDVKLIRIE